MIVPDLFARRTRRHRRRLTHHLQPEKRQLGDIGHPKQFTTPVVVDDEGRSGPSTTATTRGRVGNAEERTRSGSSIGHVTAVRSTSTSIRLASTSISSRSRFGSATPTTRTNPTPAITTTARTSPTSQDLIFLTTIPSDFPLAKQEAPIGDRPGRGYVFISTSQLGDAMLLFAVFCAGLFIFALLLIRLTRAHERRTGREGEDQMVREDMRWAEGLEVVEKRIVFSGSGDEGVPPVPPPPGGHPPVHLAKQPRQRLGR